MSGSFKKGRPKKDAADRRDQWLPPVRVTADEREQLYAQAAKLKLKPQQYVRAKLLESPLYLPQFRKLPDEVQHTLASLLKLSGLLLHLSHKVAADDLYAEHIRHSALELSDIVARSRAFVRERLTDYAGEIQRQRVRDQLLLLLKQVDDTPLPTDDKLTLISQLHQAVNGLND